MIDSHCHLDYCDDPHAAASPDLRAMVSIGTSLERSKASLQLADTYSNVWSSVGIHPNNASDAKQASLREEIETLAKHPKVVAIGETGFDTHWDKESLDTQREAFLWQASLAKDLDKALILHVRDKQNSEAASRAAAEMIDLSNYSKGILHCCNGHEDLLKVGLKHGWYVSFAGNVTYKNASLLHEVAKRIPQNRLLVETDSPFLSPVPKRGKPNVPANVHYTAAFLASLRKESVEELEAYTDKNAKEVYGLNEL